MTEKNQKVYVVVGPTCSGKSDYAVDLAKKIGGEVISADSRQVYRGLDIGTGKITKKEMRGVKHYMLDIADPKREFSVAKYVKMARVILEEIIARGKTPIICGGTGFYISALLGEINLPEVPPNKKLRKELAEKKAQELLVILKKLDKERAETIDAKNPARLIRAIEIAKVLGKVPRNSPVRLPYKTIKIGLDHDDEIMKKKIRNRLIARLKRGMIAEAEKLHQGGLTYKRMYMLGLEYRYLAELLKKKITKTEFIEIMEKEIWHYLKRQRTWFRKDKNIDWINNH